MGWRETCAMDERMRFVMSCEAGEESFSALCRGYGVSRRTGYKWLPGPGPLVPSGWWTARGGRIRIRTGLLNVFASG